MERFFMVKRFCLKMESIHILFIAIIAGIGFTSTNDPGKPFSFHSVF